MDTLEPLQGNGSFSFRSIARSLARTVFFLMSSNRWIKFVEFLNSKLPPVPEEEDMFRGGSLNPNYPDIDLMTPINQMNELNEEATSKDERSSTVLPEERGNGMQNLQYTGKIYNQTEAETSSVYRNDM